MTYHYLVEIDVMKFGEERAELDSGKDWHASDPFPHHYEDKWYYAISFSSRPSIVDYDKRMFEKWNKCVYLGYTSGDDNNPCLTTIVKTLYDPKTKLVIVDKFPTNPDRNTVYIMMRKWGDNDVLVTSMVGDQGYSLHDTRYYIDEDGTLITYNVMNGNFRVKEE